MIFAQWLTIFGPHDIVHTRMSNLGERIRAVIICIGTTIGTKENTATTTREVARNTGNNGTATRSKDLAPTH